MYYIILFIKIIYFIISLVPLLILGFLYYLIIWPFAILASLFFILINPDGNFKDELFESLEEFSPKVIYDLIHN